jgi:hypothetical protein
MGIFRPAWKHLTISTNLGPALGDCYRDGARVGSLGKAAAEADPLVFHLLVVPLHIVELHR